MDRGTVPPIRIAMLSAFPPLACGVADASACLAGALEDKGGVVTRVRSDRWRLSDLAAFRRACQRVDAVHLHYPTQESRTSLLPHLIALLPRSVPRVVTIYDISVMHALRRLSCLAFTGVSWLVFTTSLERDACVRIAPWVRGRSSVIPIGSNLPLPQATGRKTPGLVAYFGLFRPNKGIETFLEAARVSKRGGLPFRFVAIGREQAARAGYLNAVREIPGAEDVDWRVDLGPDAASAALCEAQFAYLPFPDGVSERRGSLLAALNSRAIVLTTRGPQTPAELDNVVRFAPAASSAVRQMQELAHDAALRETIADAAKNYLARRAWPNIAEAHLEIYAQLRRGGMRPPLGAAC